MTPQENAAFTRLVDLGWSPAAAAGIVGNLVNESGRGLDPTLSHDQGTGYGIAGWRDPQPGQGRWTNLRNFAAERGLPVSDRDTQLQFLDHELRTSEKSVGARLKAATDPARAAATFIDYERPGGWQRGNPTGANGYDNRVNAAARLYQTYGAMAPQPKRASLSGGTVETAALPPVSDVPDLDTNAQPTAGHEDISDLIAEGGTPAQAAPAASGEDISDLIGGAEDTGTAPDKEMADFTSRALGNLGRATRVESRTKELQKRVGPLDTTLQGVSFGLGDEMSALTHKLVHGGSYDEEVQAQRQALERYKADNPWTSAATEIGGSLVTLPKSAATQAGSWLSRAADAAKAGTAYGALYGFGTGEGLDKSISGAVSGGLLGGAIGGGASAGIDALGALGRAGINAVRAPFRGIANPEAEALRRVGTAVQQDIGPVPPALAELGMRAAQKTAPAVVGDIGGETTKALARSAANTSPAGRDALQMATQPRFSGQAGRLEDVLRTATGAKGDNAAVRESLQEAARKANKPAYDAAYKAGESVWNPQLEALTGAPAMQTAIKDATSRSRNVAAVEGMPAPKNPFNVDVETGVISLKRNPDGSMATPSLQFWDVVKRNLDSQISTLKAGGDKDRAREIDAIRRNLLNNLDNAVPEFRTARQGAAQFFGADNALEAGQEFAAKSSMPLAEATRAFNKMTGPEKKLFIEGWTSELMDKLRRSPDRQDILKRLFNSAEERGKAELLLGKNGTRQLEAHLKVEDLMERFRTAISGNSTTARQLTELGLAGGAGAIAGGGNLTDPKTLLTAALVYGARRGAVKIDERVARRVGEMLASDDPAILRRALEIVSKQPALRGALDYASQWAARAFPIVTPKPEIPNMMGMIGGRANDEDKKE